MGVIFYLFFPPAVFAEEIQDFSSTLGVQADGRLAVDEDITYNFGNEFRHGIYRTIPVFKTNAEGKRFVLSFSQFSVLDKKGASYQFSTTKTDQSVSLKIGDGDRTVTGLHDYTIHYTVDGAFTYFSDHDELYWNVTGNEWGFPINHVTVSIVMPSAIPFVDMTLTCFTGITGSVDHNCRTSYIKGVASITTTTPLAADEGLTVVVGFPKNIIAVVEPTPYIPFWATVWGKIIIVLLMIAGVCWYVAFPVYIPIAWWLHGKDPKPIIGEVSAWFDPPKSKTGRNLTPGETGTLVDEQADMDDITATIVDLARRGHLRIVESKKGAFDLERLSNTKKDVELRAFETSLLEGIFETDILVRLKTTDLSEPLEQVKKDLYDAVVAEGFFQKSPESTRLIYSVIAIIALSSLNFPLALSAFIFGRNMPRKTLHGSGQAAVARSLKKFLSSQERQLTFQAKNQMFFEKLLPYAIAFGVETIWAKRFADISMKQPSWYQGYSSRDFNSILFVHALSSTGSGIARAATPASSSRGFSSGFSGGSSGGGGGGGGGGSW